MKKLRALSSTLDNLGFHVESRYIDKLVAKASSIADATRAAIETPVHNEQLVATENILISFGEFEEPWEVFIMKGDNYSGSPSGRILLGYIDMPAGGIKWFEENGRAIITHYYLEEDVRNKKVISKLLDIYKKYISERIIITGPFSPEGRSVADKKADEIVEFE
jgi:hypothetical protein